MRLPVSPEDPRLGAYRVLRDRDLLERQGLFIAEGHLVVRRLLEDRRFQPESLLLSPAGSAQLADLLDARPELPAYVLPPSDIEQVVGFNVHRGCLAAARRGPERDWRTLSSGARLLLGAEAVGDADNVGSLFRHAAAFGAGGVLLNSATVDPLYRKAIRTSMGATLRVPFARVDDWPGALRALQGQGFVVAALTPDGSARPLRGARTVLGDRPVVLLAGHEGAGLAPDTLALADLRVCIPMAPGTDSLNVAAAVAIALYELTASPA